MEWGFSWLLDFVNGFFAALVSILRWVADGIVWAIHQAVYVLFDLMLNLVYGVIAAFDLTSFIGQISGLWGLLPPGLAYLINECGITQGLSMIGSAMLIRLILNLIPGTLTRV